MIKDLGEEQEPKDEKLAFLEDELTELKGKLL